MEAKTARETENSLFDPLPNRWQTDRLHNIAELRTSNVDKKSEEGEEEVWLCNYVDVYYHNKITSEIDFMQATASEAEIKRFSLQDGDVVITKDSESPDDIGVPAVMTETIAKLVCGYHLTILRPFNTTVNGRYLFYALESQISAYQFYLAANGVTRFGLTYQGTKSIKIAFPDLDEQQKIADFLDWKTGQIDALLTKKKQLIEKLQEKRIALITQAVTKGLNSEAPMRDSGIPWLGEVPEHWEVIPLGYLIEISGGMTPSTANSEYWDGAIPWVTPKDMKRERIDDSIDHVTDQALRLIGMTSSPAQILKQAAIDDVKSL